MILNCPRKSEFGFCITRLLDVSLPSRIKQISRSACAGPPLATPEPACGSPTPAPTRPARWDLINASDDQVIRYATVIMYGPGSSPADPAGA